MTIERDKSLPKKAIEKQQYCMRCGASNELHAHHRIPLTDGGPDELDNLDVLCRSCHREWHRLEGSIDYETFLDSPPGHILVLMMMDERAADAKVSDILANWRTVMMMRAWQSIGGEAHITDDGMIFHS